MSYSIRADKLGKATETYVGFETIEDARAEARRRLKTGFDEIFVYDAKLNLVWSVDKKGKTVLRQPAA